MICGVEFRLGVNKFLELAGIPKKPQGVQLLVLTSDNRVLMGKRGLHKSGANMWGLIGGHIRPREDSRTAGKRELDEEVIGLELSDPHQLSQGFEIDTTFDKGNKQRQAVFLLLVNDVNLSQVVPRDMSFLELGLFDLNNLPENIFPPSEQVINQYLLMR